jgi:hypothetical protein
MAQAGGVPVNDSVGFALRFVRENWRFVLTAAGAGAIATTLIAALRFSVPQISAPLMIVSTLVEALVFASLIGGALKRRTGFDASSLGEAGRVWAAMVIVGFFMVLVYLVLIIPGAMVLALGPMTPYLNDLQAAGQDQARVMAVMMRFVEANPGWILGFLVFYGVLWLALTSRLYLAAPASLEQKRILTFETWSWTKNNMLRIMGARLMLLLPAYILASALAFLVGRLVGIDIMDGAGSEALARANPALFLAYVAVASFVSYGLYSSLEAGLSSALYRHLKPDPSGPFA